MHWGFGDSMFPWRYNALSEEFKCVVICCCHQEGMAPADGIYRFFLFYAYWVIQNHSLLKILFPSFSNSSQHFLYFSNKSCPCQQHETELFKHFPSAYLSLCLSVIQDFLGASW